MPGLPGGVLMAAGEDPYADLDSLDMSVAVGGEGSLRRDGRYIRFEVDASAVTLSPDEAEEIALGLIIAARRARRESR